MRFSNLIDRVTPDRTGVGAGLREESVRVIMRLTIGALGTGYQTQHEDIANAMYERVQDMFARRWQLQSPTTNEAFRYLAPGSAANIVDIVGLRSFQFSGDISVLAMDFILDVRLQYKQARLT
jgi:hypothetical protein